MSLDQEGEFLTGARLVNKFGNVTLEEGLSLCIRFKFKLLGEKFERSNAVNIENKHRF